MIPIATPYIGKEERANVIKAIDSGWISSKGSFIDEFETGFAKFVNTKYAVSTTNGTTALHLALLALGITEKDEVIVPSFSFIASANAIAYMRAKSVFVEVNKNDFGINISDLEKKITKKTKAIIAVHLYGQICDMDPILKIAKKHKIAVVEDVAEAHGATYKGKIAGSMGDISCFSLFGNKILTTGEGGMCCTNNKKYNSLMRIYRDHGKDVTIKDPNKVYWHPVVGYNYRTTNLQAAIGVAQLKKVGKILKARKNIQKIYEENLEQLAKTGNVELYPKNENVDPAIWFYSIFVKKRGKLIEYLKEHGIETRPFFWPIHKQPAYAKDNKDLNFPVTEQLAKTGINLPTFVNLKEEDIIYICKTIANFYKK